MCARFAVPRIDRATLEAWQAEPDRTTFLLDVRSPEEFLAGHLPGSVSAPGGQLVQATDRYVGTLRRAPRAGRRRRRARRHDRILAEADGAARGCGAEGGLSASRRTSRPARGPSARSAWSALRYREIAPDALRDALAAGRTQLVDLTRSVAFRAGHIAGARHGVRTRLAALIPACRRTTCWC